MKSMPYSVGKLLDAAIARVRRGYLLRGVALVGIVWTVAVAAVMAVDSRCVIFDDCFRWGMTAATWLAVLVAALLAIVRPLRRKLDLARMAKIIDARHPEQEERLSTLVELSERDSRAAGFSAGLFSLVCDLAAADAAKLDARREFSLRRPMLWFAAALALLIALAGAVAASPSFVGRLFVRAVAPWVDIGNVHGDEIVVSPGDVVALSGTVVQIHAESRDKSAATPAYDIRISRRNGITWSPETAEEMPGGVYRTTADINEREWRYRIHSGPAVSRYYYVHVSEMPKYDSFTATVTYPAYTRRAPVQFHDGDVTSIRAIQGSQVKFDVKVSDPGTLADFRIDGEPVFEHTMVSNCTSSWSLDLVNRDGFRAEKGRHALTSFVDQPPMVVIEKPTGTLRLPPHAKIPVEITASDDIALTSAYLRVSIDDDPWERHYGTKIALTSPLLRTTAEVDLALYDLASARNIRFDVVVEDGCPPEYGGPHAATSMPFTVQFNANENSYGQQTLKNEIDEANRDIDEARRRLNDAQNLGRQVRDALRREKQVSDSTEKTSERLAHELDQARKRVEELREKFADDERLAPLTKPMDRLLDQILRPALEQVENAPFREREERADEVDAAIPKMAEAVQDLEELKKRLNDRAGKLNDFERRKDLLARQEALARAAEEIRAEHPVDTRKLEAWKRLQEEAMRRADELLRKAPDPELREAKRKMETAAREMDELKRELDRANDKRLNDQQRAEQRERERKADAQRRLQELRNALNEQRRAADLLKRAAHAQAAEAQRAAEDRMERGQASEFARALQQIASDAASRQKPDAAALQQKALDELKREVAAAEADAKQAEPTDRSAEYARQNEAFLNDFAARARERAEKAIEEARRARAENRRDDFSRLAEEAFEAARDRLAAEMGRPQAPQADALAKEVGEMNALSNDEDQAAAREDKILQQQKDAKVSLERADYGRARFQQGEAEKAQKLQAESVPGDSSAAASRAEANRAQREANAARQAAESNRRDAAKKQEAIEAENLAMEKERQAQAEMQQQFAAEKLAAAERSLAEPVSEQPDSDGSPHSTSQDSPSALAANALKRDVEARAAELNIKSLQSNAEQPLQNASSGGVADEVARLASELRRTDDPNFFRKLFSRFGWFRLHGTSKEGLGERDLRDIPPEYRDLVRRYFLKVGASAEPPR